MIIFKSCVRCHGDVYLNQDEYGQFLDCLQCGAMTDVPLRIDVTAAPDVA